MKIVKKQLLWALALGLWGSAEAAIAAPGQPVDEVKAWMQAHPTLRAEAGRLQVQRTETPARQFTFRATVFPIGGPGDAAPALLDRSIDRSRIRAETFTLTDRVSGVTYEALEEALRVIYGPDLYADYRRSASVRTYPAPPPARLLQPNRSDAQGQVRQGELYAYWLELIPNRDGTVYIGSISVLLPADLDQLQAHLAQTGR